MEGAWRVWEWVGRGGLGWALGFVYPLFLSLFSFYIPLVWRFLDCISSVLFPLGVGLALFYNDAFSLFFSCCPLGFGLASCFFFICYIVLVFQIFLTRDAQRGGVKVEVKIG